MLRPRTAATALLALLAAMALGACGGDDENGSGGATRAQGTATATETGTTETTGTAGQAANSRSNPRGKELTPGLRGKGLTAFVNPGGQADADFQLVVNAGGGGVLYAYADEAAARAAKAKVDRYEGSSGRDVEVIGDTVFAFFPPDQRLAQPDKQKKTRECASS